MRALRLLFLVLFVNLVGFGITVPMLPFLAQHLGANPTGVALVIATYSAMQMLAAPLWGRLSDRFGRKPVILSGFLGSLVAYLMLAYADSLTLVFASRAVDGFMTGNVVAAAAYVADVTKPEDRAKGMGLIGAAFGLAFIFGPAIGAIAVGANSANPDFVTPALAAAGLSALAIVIAALLLRESLDRGHAAAPEHVPLRARVDAALALLRRVPVGLLCALTFLAVFVFAGMESTFALWAERAYQWGPREVGYVFAYAGAIAVVVQGGLIGPLTKRFGEARLVVAASASLGFGLLLIPFAVSLPLLLLAMSFLAYGLGSGNPSLQSLLSQAAPEQRKGATLGLGQSASSLGRIFGPAWAGYAFTSFGRDAPYFTGAAVMLLMLGLAIRGLRPSRLAQRQAAD